MSYNGAGQFSINSVGQPVVPGTIISDTAFNALTADLATGLSTAICKDGQSTITNNLPMSGFHHTGASAANATGQYLVYGQSAASLAGLTLSAALTYGGVTLANAVTGTGNMVLNTSPQLSGTVTFPDASTWSGSGVNVLSDITGGHITMQGAGGGYYRCTGFGITTTLGIDSIATNVGSGGSYSGFGIINNTNGVVLANGGTSWGAISDYRAKDVSGAFTSSGPIFDAVPVHLAALKTEPDKFKPMFLAHELQAAVPHAVHGEKDALKEDGSPQFQFADTTDPLVPILWAETRALRARVAALEAPAANGDAKWSD